MSKRTEREIAIVNLVKRGVPYEDAKAIRRYAASYNTIQERWCNEPMDDATVSAVTMRENSLITRITRLLNQYGLGVSFSGDPRGATVKGVSTSDEYGIEEWMIA